MMRLALGPGSFVFSLGPIHSGLHLHDGGVSVVPLAGGAWLDEKLREQH